MGDGIHPTAVVARTAEIGNGVEIGPYCCVGADVVLGDNVVLHSHVIVDGHTRIGARTKIFPFASLGLAPQDLKYEGEASELVIGTDNTIREYVTMNPGTKGGRMLTRIGSHCLFMIGVHVAHDCQVGDYVIMANNATLGGHVTIGDHAILGGLCAIHQFVRIGPYAMIGGMTGVENDVIPYGSVMGERGRLSGLNVIGLKRRGFSKEQIHNLRSAYRLLFAGEDSTFGERLSATAERYRDDAAVMSMVRFIQAESSRGLTQPRLNNGA